jgi:hypothetical protein
MPKNFFKIFLLIFLLSSCGFQVIYKDQYLENSMANQLASIVIRHERNQLAQTLKNNLSDTLNPDYIKTDIKYFLELDISTSVGPTFTNVSGGSGRNKVVLTVKYILKNLKTSQQISVGSTEVFDSYDVSSNRFATYTADEFIKENLTKIVAQNIRNSIVNDLVEEIKECQENIGNKQYKCLVEIEKNKS